MFWHSKLSIWQNIIVNWKFSFGNYRKHVKLGHKEWKEFFKELEDKR